MGPLGFRRARVSRLIPRLATSGYSGYRLGSNLARRARFALNRGFTGSVTRRRRGHGGMGITTQHDKSLIYRKRVMRKRLKRRWKKFGRKINAISEKDLGSRTVVRNDQVDIPQLMTTSASANHNRWYFMLYGGSSVTAYYNDVNEISADTDLGTTGKAIFKSGVVDFTIRNTSTRLPTSLNPPITLELDVYEITCNREIASLTGAFSEGSTDTATIPGQTTGLTGSLRGWTPWDFPSALSEYRIKIWKKTKYFLSENQVFTYQYRDPKRHVLDKQRMSTANSENLIGISRYFYFVFKPTPGYTYSDAAPDTYAISVGVTRKYLYKIKDQTQDYDMYNT